MEWIIGYVIGVITYAIVSTIRDLARNTWGVLHVDHSNPEKDVYKLSIDNLDCLDVKKRVILRVKHENEHSQK